MRPAGFIPATFSFSERAIAKIQQLRHQAEARNGEPIGAVGFAWGHVQLNDGTKQERPMIGFYSREQMDKVALESVQIVDGIGLIVFSTPDQAKSFDNSTIDFTDGTGFLIAKSQNDADN